MKNDFTNWLIGTVASSLRNIEAMATQFSKCQIQCGSVRENRQGLTLTRWTSTYECWDVLYQSKAALILMNENPSTDHTPLLDGAPKILECSKQVSNPKKTLAWADKTLTRVGQYTSIPWLCAATVLTPRDYGETLVPELYQGYSESRAVRTKAKEFFTESGSETCSSELRLLMSRTGKCQDPSLWLLAKEMAPEECWLMVKRTEQSILYDAARRILPIRPSSAKSNGYLVQWAGCLQEDAID